MKKTTILTLIEDDDENINHLYFNDPYYRKKIIVDGFEYKKVMEINHGIEYYVCVANFNDDNVIKHFANKIICMVSQRKEHSFSRA